ncbi:type VI secretion system secreted protein VgrG [Variovorax paradoxus]|uniref:type VI secretion system Vgr family protein n=1 Tax=Variovorax paradoxus TaxID=34073 RepID=UPI00277E0ABE|nr:type VI secretion system tip protein TssI/VgrG [Variovorax paradoxus]MDQ0022738.1 type VI secretion system secreted protein VgrG [Variovorax paradoxus]
MAEEKFHIKSESPAVDDLMFWSLAGHESLSRASFYELTVVSKNRAISATDILGRAFDVMIDFADADGGTHQRHCHGHAVRFVRVHELGRHFEYRITLRSWFWLLTKRKNSRIFQVKPTLEVFDATLDDSPIKRVKKTNVDQVIGKHDALRYCVQFEETDYNFLSRLMEQEGIHYWFDAHDAPGTMYLADASDIAHAALPVADTLAHVTEQRSEARFNEISRWVSATRLDTGKYASTDSNFKTINTLLSVTADGSGDCELADFESFEFPGGYFHKETSDVVGAVRRDELVGRRERHWALTAWPDVAAGRSFKFEGDPDGTRDGEYTIAACTFFVSHPGYEGLDQAPQLQPVADMLRAVLADDPPNLENLGIIQDLFESAPQLRGDGRDASVFVTTVMPQAMPYRPPRLTPFVKMPGLQSAIVVGPKGQENEPYVDEFGRVKVHFHWDRYDERDEKSTCWVRVSQPWAGKSWGGYFMPRIGQEVLVDFLEGNPNRPVIVGRVYNDDQPIPYESPTQSGFKTRSTPKGGAGNYNEIMFEDKKGAENINIHAERNMSRSVEVDDSISIGRDQSSTVDRDRTALVKRNEKNTVAEVQTNVVGISQSNTIGSGGQKTQVAGFQENIFHAGQKTSVVGMQNLTVTANQDNAIGGFQKTVVGANMDVGVVGFQTTSVGADSALLVTGNTKIQSGGVRNDVTGGKHAIMANEIKLVSNTNIELMAVANINATSVGSNTTVLGTNSSGYIGSNSEANLGMNRSTFIGLNMSNALAVDISNFLGAQIENTAAVRLTNVAAACISQKTIDVNLTTLEVIGGGAGAGAAAASSTAGMVAGFAIGAASVVAGLFDVAATFEQYEKAEADLKAAAAEANAQGLTALGSRLGRLADIASRRRTEGALAAIPLVGGVAVAGAELLGGTAAEASGDALGKAPHAAAGAAPALPAAPVIPAVPPIPAAPPRYVPPGG